MKFIPEDFENEIQLRISALQRRMKRDGMEALIAAIPADIYYTTLRVFRGYVYIPAEDNAIWFVIKPDVYEPDARVSVIRKPENIPGILEERGLPVPKTVGYEFESLSYADTERLKSLFPEAKALNGSAVFKAVRMVKTPWEIERMREDGIHQAEAYRRVTRCYREDMTDLEFQIEIERILRLEGCLGFVRTSGNMMDINLGSVIAGDNADNPSPFDFAMGGSGVNPSLPVGANGTTLKPGETVMVDMNGSFNGYQTDMTRVWRLGNVAEKAVRAHECSRRILRECEQLGRPGCKVADLYHKAVAIAEGEGLRSYFMGHRQQAPFIGHGIGIELNEMPAVSARSKDVFEENMTIALEPKFVIPGTGAVGVENTYVVTKEGLEPLTVFPEEMQEL